MASTHRDTCRICLSKDVVKFLSFGDMPLAGGFIKKEDIKNEKLYPLDVYLCRNCKEVQVLDVVPADDLFKDYRYLSSVVLSEHFTEYAQIMKDRFGLDEKSLVVEFGSNDGVLQKPFKDLGILDVGVEPSVNVSSIAKEKGLTVVNDYFTKNVADAIVKEYGKADLICANNTFAHIDDMHEVMRGVKTLLKDDGVYVFEVHYLVDLVRDYQYDTIYHEHLMYHSVTTLSHLFELFEMEIFDVERIPIHCGSIRVYTRRKSKKPKEKSVGELLALEKEIGLDKEETFSRFAAEIRRKREDIVGLVKRLKSEGKRIVGYGASGRASTNLAFCNFSTREIDYIVDMSPERQNRFTPGTHIPIVSPDVLKKDKPDYALLLAYNYAQQIIEKEKDFTANGGRFIIPLPEVRII